MEATKYQQGAQTYRRDQKEKKKNRWIFKADYAKEIAVEESDMEAEVGVGWVPAWSQG